jgi:parvulin-like peptidyl-prolyl isomerase
VAVKILATVGNVPILEEEVAEARARYILSMPESERRAFNSLPPSERTRTENDISKLVLDQLIDREVVLQEAMRRLGTSQGQRQLDKIRELAGKEFDKQLRTIKTQHRLKTDEDVKNFLRDQGVSVDALRRQAEREFLYMEYIRYRVAPALERIGHREIVDYYHRHPEEFQTVDSVQWQDIFIAAAQHPSRELARRLAEQILARVQAGEDFAQLAAEYDGGVSRIRSGQGQGRRRGEIQPPEVEPILFQMQDGQVGPLVELPTGFHIIRLVQRDYAGQVPLDAKTQNQIRDKLRNEVFRREAKRTVEELRRRATIERSSPLP